MTPRPQRCLIIPCETRSREFDAKLLLAVLAASRGIEAYVGAKKPIDSSLDRIPPGVYIAKGLGERARISLRLALACGHELALWDEEGLVWSSPEVYWHTKVHGPNLALPGQMLAWGEANAEAWRTHPQWPGTPLAIVGNPRMDLLRPGLRALYRPEVESLAQRHGPYVLINTNFSRVNNFQPRQNRHLKWLREHRPDDPRGGFARHKLKLFEAFVALLPRLCQARPQTRFILRPHPSEAMEVWQSIAAGIPNLVIERDGGIVPWLLAADAVIHNGCTTAVEAWMLRCPALAFVPIRCDRYDHPLPNGISLPCRSLAELLVRIDKARIDRAGLFAHQAHDQRRQQLLARNLASASQPTLDSDRILDCLAGLLARPGRAPRRARAVMLIKRIFAATARHISGAANYGPYLDHMFPQTSLAEAQARADQLTSALNLNQTVRLDAVGNRVFRVTGN